MERFTFFTDDYPVVTCKHCYEDQNENYCGPAIERLAEYEATGLMPAEVAALVYKIAEIEKKVVQMNCYDDNITESRVFRIKFHKLLNPDEAMDIFVRNVKQIFEKQSGDSGLFK